MGPTTNPGSPLKPSQDRRKPRRTSPEGDDPSLDTGETQAAEGNAYTESGMNGDMGMSDPITADPAGHHLHEDDDAESVESRPLALQRALREVEAAVDAEFVASMDLLETLGRKEEDLQSRLEELYLELGTVQDALAETSREARDALDRRSATFARRHQMQARVIHRTLCADAEELLTRQRVWQQRNEFAETRLRALKDDPKLADMITEFRQLDVRMDTLDLLPESYRGVVKAHHTDLKAKLAPHLEEPKADPLTPLDIAVAVAIAGGRRDGSGDSEPARLLAVLPVDPSTHERAREGANDLTARFAFRVLAALSRFVVNIGARAEPEPTALDGLLGIELPFDDLDIPATPADLARALRDSFADARDSRLSKINVSTDIVFVSMAALDSLWDRKKDEEKPEGAAHKADTSRRRTKNSRRRK